MVCLTSQHNAHGDHGNGVTRWYDEAATSRRDRLLMATTTGCHGSRMEWPKQQNGGGGPSGWWLGDDGNRRSRGGTVVGEEGSSERGEGCTLVLTYGGLRL
ncbi:hypothetical protein E2562_017124 [Oryza meyeriana var. granulata]|uniref:Uncharacterized protein n=1 Tax=Oryza meyeriana var. granulata TaxID=110450 RepID=A0A6G1DZV2_9ORYZ|nr:hypothetical protein E2562_017124 [Oryza meyeriana var. granulata]